MIKTPIKTIKATKKTINTVIAIGALYVDESGIHANEPGIYPKQEKIPVKTGNQDGD